MLSISSYSRSASQAIAADFHVGIPQIVEAIFWTLVMRPLGALIFGMLAERVRSQAHCWIARYLMPSRSSCWASPGVRSRRCTHLFLLICRRLFGIAMELLLEV